MPRRGSVEVWATFRPSKDIVLDDIPGNNCKLSIGDTVNRNNWNLRRNIKYKTDGCLGH
jgi:hypothetical protein